MALEEYNKKRNFKKTPEPSGKVFKREKQLRFVVQKHDASHLHYDFRLEMEGVIKSWAIPKGPSLNPKDKRLAVMTEDHPISYNTFEGHIPEGEYGGGDVIVWDTGTYQSEDTTTAKESEEILVRGFKKGSFTFFMNGKKLRGLFTLTMLKKNPKQWLLIKKNDEYASEEDITLDNSSVLSKKSLIGRDEDRDRYAKKPSSKKTRVLTSKKLKKLPVITPMLATLTDAAFDDPSYIYEIKWDGYRAVAAIEENGVSLYSRNQKSFNEKYPKIVEALEEMEPGTMIDGEIVGYDESGNATFQTLQNVLNQTVRLEYVVFDILYHKGESVMDLPLLERKKLLQEIVPDSPYITFSEHIEKDGKKFFELAKKKNLEGIMAKKADSPYVPERRTEYWLKIKHHRTDEAVIAGFTEPKGSRKYFGSLVLGQYKDGEFVFIGHTGTGFNQTILKDLYTKMQPLVNTTSPFKTKVPLNSPITWIKPELVAQIKFGEWTTNGIMRQPVYLGLREDKGAEEVTTEKIHSSKNQEFSNVDKIYFPKIKLTKGDVLTYYEKIAPFILPYLKDRPESLLRHPNGVGKPGFFQKNITNEVPEFVETISLPSESTKQDVNYLLCQNKETLLYMANLGCIEINPWSSHIGSLEKPDYMVLDIDPDDSNTWSEIVKVAKAVKEVLDISCETGYIKTSGKTGVYIFIPLGAKYRFEEVRTFSELLANLVHKKLPKITSLERSPKNRKGKIYIDYLQNSQGQTLAAPYSLRPTEDATVATPFHWDELNARVDLRKTNTKTIFKRLEKYGDIWKGMLSDTVDLHKAIVCLEKETK